MGEQGSGKAPQPTQAGAQESQPDGGDADHQERTPRPGGGGGVGRGERGSLLSSTWVTTVQTAGPHQPVLAVWVCRTAGSGSENVGEREGGAD